MTIGVLYLDLRIPEARSLKDRRRVLQGLKEQLRSRFNCSVAETEPFDVWTRAQVVVCVVSNEHRHANTQLNEIAQFAAARRGAELMDYRIEML